VTTTVEEFNRDVVGDPSSDTSPEALGLFSGLMSSGKTTSVDEIIEYLKESEDSEVNEEVSRHESDEFRWEMLEYGIVPESWEKEEYPEDATLEEAVERTSESEEGSEHDIDRDAEVEDVVTSQEVYEMLGDWTLNSEGIALYDGSVDRNHELVEQAAELDSNVVLAVQPVLDDAWRKYIEDWGGDSEEFLEKAGDFVDIYGDVLEKNLRLDHVEELKDMAENPHAYVQSREESLNPLMEDLSRIMNQPGKYLREQYADDERFRDEVDSLKQYSGRLGELAENIDQQDETIRLAESLDGVEVYCVADRDATSGEARYGNQERPSTGDPEGLVRILKQGST
jgi:hypothetical protein